MERKDTLYVAIIVILAVTMVGVLFGGALITGTQNQAIGRLTAVYELITEDSVEVLSVEEISGVYKVLLRVQGTTGDSLEEVYVTKDGNLITDKIIDTVDYKVRLENQKAFMECMKEKKIMLFGQNSEPNTLQQLQVLGSFSYKIYVDCVGANLEVCQQIGIQQIPSVVYEGKSYSGVKAIEWFEELTGCVMG